MQYMLENDYNSYQTTIHIMHTKHSCKNKCIVRLVTHLYSTVILCVSVVLNEVTHIEKHVKHRRAIIKVLFTNRARVVEIVIT